MATALGISNEQFLRLIASRNEGNNDRKRNQNATCGQTGRNEQGYIKRKRCRNYENFQWYSD